MQRLPDGPRVPSPELAPNPTQGALLSEAAHFAVRSPSCRRSRGLFTRPTPGAWETSRISGTPGTLRTVARERAASAARPGNEPHRRHAERGRLRTVARPGNDPHRRRAGASPMGFEPKAEGFKTMMRYAPRR